MSRATKKQKTGESASPPPLAVACSGDNGSRQADTDAASSNEDPPSGVELFATLPGDVLIGAIGSFLSPNDVTNIGLTSTVMLEKVSSSRRGKTCIIWVERWCTEIVYQSLEVDLCDVSQGQVFTFLVQDSKGETFRVVIRLLNEVWQEELNMQDGRHCRPVGRPSPTTYKIWIRDKSELFYCDTSPYGDYELDFAMPDERLLMLLDFMMICAECIDMYPDQLAYPSTEYLMRSLPEVTHPFFPSRFKWEAEHLDRNTEVEFIYRPARTLEEWLEFAADPDHELLCLYRINELPWYCEGYKWF